MQTLEKVKGRLDAFLSSRAVLNTALPSSRGSQGLELLRDGYDLCKEIRALSTDYWHGLTGVGARRVRQLTLTASRRITAVLPPHTSSLLLCSSALSHLSPRLHQLLRVLDACFDSVPAADTASNEQQMEYVEKRLASALSELSRGPQDSLEHHLFTTVARALVPPTPARPSSASLPATPNPAHSLAPLDTPSGRVLQNSGGGGSGGAGGGAGGGASGGGCGTPDSTYRGNDAAKKEVERLQRKMEQMQKTTDDLQKELQAARGEAEQARAVKPSWVQEREREVAERDKSVKGLERELAQERQDCAHYKDSCQQLERSREELEEHAKQVEAARKTAVEALRAAESSASQLRSELVTNEANLSKLRQVCF